MHFTFSNINIQIFTFSCVYFRSCLFENQWNVDIDKTKVWRIWKWNVSFSCKIKGEGCSSLQVIRGQLSIFNKKWHRTCTVVTYDERHPPIIPYNPLAMSCEVTLYLLFWKTYDTNLGMVLTYDEGNSAIMSHDSPTTWSRKVTWKFKSWISPIPRCLLPPILTGRWHISSSQRSMITKLCKIVNYDKINSPIMSRDSVTT